MEKDFTSSSFFSDNERYADIINGIGCEGVPFVKGKDLQELDTKINLGSFRGHGHSWKRKKRLYRDLVRKTPFGINFAIIGIENQEEIDYALPLRVLCYDTGEYEKQAAQIRREVRREKKRLSSGEYLYGFRKNSRLCPVVTFVLYYGEKEWDGAKDLYGLLDFREIPEALKEKISNYQIHVIEIRKIADTSIFKTDVKQVFDFIRYSGDKKKLKELVTTDESYAFLDEDACDMMLAYVGEEEMLKIKEKYKKGGKVNMCQGLKEWMEDERTEGRTEGRAEGENRFASLTENLIKNGRTDDLMHAAIDKQYREILFRELNL